MDIRNELLENYETVFQLPLHARYGEFKKKTKNLWHITLKYFMLFKTLYSFDGCMLKLAFCIIKICNFSW